jgi:membrane protein DedA with SNARE-associated domain
MYEFFLQVVWFVESLGYFGLFFMTFIESTFIPIPAEITLIPAGYLVQKGEMNGLLVWIASTLGTIGGSIVNYYIAYFFGRKLFINKGKYFFMNEKKLQTIERFFKNHGAVSTFTGRLLPGVKHFISFPAGLAKMDKRIFISYTAAGGAIWCAVLITLGYYIGENEHLIKKYLKQVNFALVVLVSAAIAFYIWRKSSYKVKE